MQVYRLPYKLLLMFVLFFVLFAIPFMLVTYGGFDELIGMMDDQAPLLPEQESQYEGYASALLDDLVFLSFYIFVLAFIISLFLLRSFFVSLKELHRGAVALREGRFDARLESATSDELGEVIMSFNNMAGSLRKQNDELMRKNQYVNAMVDPLWVVDNDNVVVDVNPAFSRLFGYEKEDVLGSSIFDFLDEEAEKLMRRKFYETVDAVGGQAYETSMITKNEGLIPVLLSVAPITAASGEQVGRIGIIKDFRGETALREDIRREKDNTEAIMDSMADHVLVVGHDFRIIRANRSAQVSAGRDISGELCHKVFHGRDQKCFLHGEDCPVKMVFDTATVYRTVHSHVLASGSKRFFELAAYPILNEDGTVRHAVEVMHDITDQKKHREELEHRNRELSALNEMSKVLAHSIGTEEVFDEVLDMLISLGDMDGGGIYLMDDMHRDLRLRFHRGLSADFSRSIGVARMGQDLPGRVGISGEGFFSRDISSDKRAEDSALKHSGVKAYACIPVRGKEKLIGVFFMFSFKAKEFNPEQLSILNAVSEMMGISFENARLYERMKDLYLQNRQRRADEQRNIMSLSSLLSSTVELKEVLEPSASLMKSVCQADVALILERHKDGTFSVLASSGDGTGRYDLMVPSGDSSLEQRALTRREPVVLTTLASREQFCIDKRFTGYGNACSIPLFIGDRDIGAITLYFKSAKDLPEEETFFLQTIGSMLAVAIERSRLHELEALQRGMSDTILESITDGVMTVDTSGKIIGANRAVGSILNCESAATVGLPLNDIFGCGTDNTEFQFRIISCYEDALSGRVSRAEGTYRASGGRRVLLVVRSAPVYDDRKNIAGVVFVLRDLSGENELEAMKTDFVKSVSHEFRTPLTAIVGMTEMVVEGEVEGDKVREYLLTVLQESRRLSDMVALVLDAAEIERGKDLLVEAEVDFASLVRSMRDSLDSVVEKKQSSLKVQLDDSIGTFRGDLEKLRQLLYNLVENSLTFSGQGSSVNVSLERSDGGVRITVSDDGWGIEPDDLSFVTEKFYRGRNALRTRGMGLGLYVAQGVAKMHGGNLSIQSEPGKGTTVTVELPSRRST